MASIKVIFHVVYGMRYGYAHVHVTKIRKACKYIMVLSICSKVNVNAEAKANAASGSIHVPIGVNVNTTEESKTVDVTPHSNILHMWILSFYIQ